MVCFWGLCRSRFSGANSALKVSIIYGERAPHGREGGYTESNKLGRHGFSLAHGRGHCFSHLPQSSPRGQPSVRPKFLSGMSDVRTHLKGPRLSGPHTTQLAWHIIQALKSVFRNFPLHPPRVAKLFPILTSGVTFSSLMNLPYLHPTSKLNSFSVSSCRPWKKSVFFYGSVPGSLSVSGSTAVSSAPWALT